MVNKISDETKQLMDAKSVIRLPAHPSASGYTEVDIRNAQYKPALDANGASLYTEINRIVEEINGDIETLSNSTSTNNDRIESIVGGTYTKEEVDSIVDGITIKLDNLIACVSSIGKTVEELAKNSDISYTFEDIGD